MIFDAAHRKTETFIHAIKIHFGVAAAQVSAPGIESIAFGGSPKGGVIAQGTAQREPAGGIHQPEKIRMRREIGKAIEVRIDEPGGERTRQLALPDGRSGIAQVIRHRHGALQVARFVDPDADLAGLHGKRVGYLKGSLRTSRALAMHPKITSVPLGSYATLAEALLRACQLSSPHALREPPGVAYSQPRARNNVSQAFYAENR